MPGTNYSEVETRFLDVLNPKGRRAARQLLVYCQLSELVHLRQFGLTTDLIEQFGINNQFDWDNMLNRAILVKVTYYKPKDILRLDHWNALVCLASQCLNMPGKTALYLSKMTEKEFPHFSKWMSIAHAVQTSKNVPLDGVCDTLYKPVNQVGA